MSVLVGCWYRDPVHRPAVGWCPGLAATGRLPTLNVPPTAISSFYCEAHATGAARRSGCRLCGGCDPAGSPNITRDWHDDAFEIRT
jgi:hypothetical protein